MKWVFALLPSAPAEWQLFMLNATNVVLGLIVAGLWIFLAAAIIAGIHDRRKMRGAYLPNIGRPAPRRMA